MSLPWYAPAGLYPVLLFPDDVDLFPRMKTIDPKASAPGIHPVREALEESGWTKVIVPVSRAGKMQDGMDRASWCLDQFGACAFSKDEVTGHYVFDATKRWAASHDRSSGEQLFFFKDNDEAALFRICRG